MRGERSISTGALGNSNLLAFLLCPGAGSLGIVVCGGIGIIYIKFIGQIFYNCPKGAGP